MDSRRNPFAPGAGTPPPELAGRDQVIESARIAIARIAADRPAKSQMLLGLRSVRKTVLLNRIEAIATDLGYGTILVEAPENKRLPEMLTAPLRQLLLRLNRGERMKVRTRSALRALRNFASAFKVSVGEFEVGVKNDVLAQSNLTVLHNAFKRRYGHRNRGG